MRFLWDENKNRLNRRKHGLSFEEASKLFIDTEYLEIFDESHSEAEDRFIAIGPIAKGVILIVFVESTEESIRIISARKATRRECRLYSDYAKGRQP